MERETGIEHATFSLEKNQRGRTWASYVGTKGRREQHQYHARAVREILFLPVCRAGPGLAYPRLSMAPVLEWRCCKILRELGFEMVVCKIGRFWTGSRPLLDYGAWGHRGKMRVFFAFTAVAALWASLLQAQGVITTVAGSARVFRGDGGPATQAGLVRIGGLALHGSGDLYAVDSDSHVIVRVSPDGTLTVVAGNGTTGYSGDGEPATNAALAFPRDVAIDPAGNVYIADTGNRRIRRVGIDGIIQTVAGTGNVGFSGDGGPATSATLTFPEAVAVDATGNLFIGDTGNHRIRRVGLDGVIRTVAGNGTAGFSGDGGPATGASLANPNDIAVDTAGNLFISDTGNARIRQVSLDGVIRTVAGSGAPGFSGDGGPAAGAGLTAGGVAVDMVGNLFVADSANNRVRRIGLDGVIRTVAGRGTVGFAGDGGPATNASVQDPQGLAVGVGGGIYIGDTANKRIRRVGADSIIQTVAGNGNPGFSGDGGPATSASIDPAGVAVDAAGSLLIADIGNRRVRRVGPDGIIRTVAGDGNFGVLRDNVPATTTSLETPVDVAVDAAGNLFIADTNNNRVVRVGLDGVIRTAAGNGALGVSPNGGSATSGPVSAPRGIGTDAAGNLYIAASDGSDHRVYHVTPGGVIRTVAGNGPGGFSGDGGPATSASLLFPRDAAVDGAGNLFIADRDNNRIRRVTLDGIIRIYAGNGMQGSSGDGGAAANASLFFPHSVAVDTAGNLFIADVNSVIRQVTADGNIRTYAGRGLQGFSGDGGPATNAALGMTGGLAVDAGGNLFIADKGNTRIRAVLATPPRFDELVTKQISLRARSGGAPVEAEALFLGASATNLPVLNPAAVSGVSFSTNTSAGASWLQVSPPSGVTPRLLRITADPASLAPRRYEGTITISMPHANPAQQMVVVAFTVDPAAAPALSVDARTFSFTYPSGTPARRESFLVSNTGGGNLPFTVRAQTDSGGNWLSVTPAAGTATPRNAVTIDVTANPQGLAVGTYTGRVIIEAQASGSPAVIAITMTVSDSNQAILLTQTGLSFKAVQGGGIVPPQTFGVVNLGRGSMSWGVTTCTLTNLACGWLRATPDGGSSDPAAQVPQVTVTIDQSGLSPGNYFGLVEVRAGGAANTPQVVTIFLEVLPRGSDPGAALTGNQLSFTATAGAGSPGSQDIFVYNVAAAAKSYRSGGAIDTGRLEILPGDGALDPQKPSRIVVQPVLENTPPGEYKGSVTLQFSDGRVREVALRLVVREAAGVTLRSLTHGPAYAGENCVPGQLLPALRTLPNGFAVSAGWPVGLQVEVKDDCGNPINDGTVAVSFSNGDPELGLTSLNNGRWDGTWQTNPRELSDVLLQIEAVLPERGLRGTTQVRGGLRSLQQAPTVPDNGIVSAAVSIAHQPLAPGSLVSLYGERLSEGRASPDSLPLPNTLAGTIVLIGGRPMPLLFASDGQVNAMVPYDLNINTRHQIVVRRGPTYARPVAVNVAAAQPEIFRLNGTQGHIYRFDAGRLILADAANPVRAGDVIVVFCGGLGAVNPLVAAGEAAPGAEPLARTVNPVRLTIRGVEAATSYTGLAPGFSGLYQINAAVPSGVTSGDAIPVQLQVAGQTSEVATIAVR